MTPVNRKNSWLPDVFNDFFDTDFMPRTSATAPAINVKESAVDYEVEVAAPGMTKEDFNVHLNQEGVDRNNISAKVADGVLTVVLPKIKKEEQNVVRQITVG